MCFLIFLLWHTLTQHSIGLKVAVEVLQRCCTHSEEELDGLRLRKKAAVNNNNCQSSHFKMADLLGSILNSMEKPPTVGDKESRRKARGTRWFSRITIPFTLLLPCLGWLKTGFARI